MVVLRFVTFPYFDIDQHLIMWPFKYHLTKTDIEEVIYFPIVQNTNINIHYPYYSSNLVTHKDLKLYNWCKFTNKYEFQRYVRFFSYFLTVLYCDIAYRHEKGITNKSKRLSFLLVRQGRTSFSCTIMRSTWSTFFYLY